MTEIAQRGAESLPGLLTDEHLDRLAPADRAALLAQAFIAKFPNPNTRAAYGKDLFLWFAFCRDAGLEPLTDPKPLHGDLWLRWLAEPHPGLYWPATGAGAAPKPVEASSARSIARRVSPVSNWYEWLDANEYSDRRPFLTVKRPKVNKSAQHGVALSPKQAAAMLDAVATDKDARANRPRNLAALWVLLGSGVRGGELASIGTDDFAVRRGQRLLIVREGKGSKSRVIPLHDDALDAVDAWMLVRPGAKPGPLLTTSTGKALDHKAVWRLVRRAARLAAKARPELGMKHIAATIAPHDTRRTYITVALDDGANIDHVARDAGHASTDTTLIYDQNRDAVERSVALDVGKLIADARLHP